MELKTDFHDRPLCAMKFDRQDFSGQDLRKHKMYNSCFFNCNFDDADMSEANCEGSNFTGSTFRQTVMYRTNCKDAKLAYTVFEPKDAFGITLTCSCKTFDHARVAPLWWYNFLMYGMLMVPGTDDQAKVLHNKLIQAIGPSRYAKLICLFGKRDI